MDGVPTPARTLRPALLVAAVGAVTLAGTAVAGAPNKEKIHLTAAGQAAARAVVLTRADIGSASGWTGGAKKPDLASTPPCASFHPRQSDLTVNGAAESVFTHAGLQIDSNVQVLATPHMVLLDWQRTVLPPQILPCLREGLAKTIGSSARVVSVQRIAIPKLATFTNAFRVLIDVPASGTTVRLLADIIVVGRSRTEVTLTTTAPYAALASVWPAELRLARLLVARIRL
jgi:hypothetical protein